LCSDCLARFAAPRPRCLQCGLGLGASQPRCGNCLHDSPAFDRTACAVDYVFPWDALIADFKFHDQPELAHALAERLAQAVAQADMPLPDLVVPVPLAADRRSERGYNQAWELARRAARQRGVAARADVLLRHQGGAHQAQLKRAERLRNLAGTFIVAPGGRDAIRARRVALVDDVLTTGATAEAAAQALRGAGAAAVDLWVLARTPAPGE
jgi:ComF family protein